MLMKLYRKHERTLCTVNSNAISDDWFNPLSANVVHARHDADVTFSGFSASYTLCFERVENLLQNCVLHFAFKLGQ